MAELDDELRQKKPPLAIEIGHILDMQGPSPDASIPEAEATPQDAATAPMPTAPKGPSPVQQYILSKLAQKGQQQDDPGLGQAQLRSALNQWGSGMSQSFGDVGRNLLNAKLAAAGMSSAIEKAPTPATDAEMNAPVNDYIAKKLRAQQAEKADIDNVKSLAQAQRAGAQADALDDPNSVRAKELAVKQQNADTNKGKLGETARWHDIEEKLKERGLSSQQAHDFITQERLKQGDRRLGMLEEKLGNTEGQGIVPTAESQERYLTPSTATELNNKVGAAKTVLGSIDSIKDIVREHRLGLLAPSEAQAQIQARLAELGPQWNAAQSKLSFTGPRAAAIQHALSDPRSASGIVKDLLTGNDYTNTNLGEAEKIIEESIRNQAGASGVQLGPKVGARSGNGPRVGSARPGRPGYQAPPDDAAAVKWAKDNPTDPRAKTILEINGAQP